MTSKIVKYSGSIDVGGTKTLVGIVDENGNLLAKKHFVTEKSDCLAHLAHCCDGFNDCLAESNLSIGDIEGIGVNMPGMVDAETGILLEAPFAKWYNVDIKGYIVEKLQIKDVFVENDVNSCAVGEQIFGGATGDFLWVTVSTGIGGAIVSDGAVLHGSNSCAGEMGHVKVEYEHPAQCSCGQWGCAEAHGSGTAITREFAKRVKNDQALTALLAERNLLPDAKSCAILAKEGNQAALEVCAEAAKYIGRALAYAANLLNPKTIYIGGGVSESLDLLLPDIRRELERDTVKQNAGVEILKTSLGYDAALLGAAALVFSLRCREPR